MEPLSPSRNLRPLLVATLALFIGGATWVIADAKRDEKPSVNVKVDAAPLPRAEDTALSLNPIVKRVTPSVVKVVTRERAKEMEVGGGMPFDDPMFRQFFGPFFGGRGGQRRILRQPPEMGLGSGIIVSADGYILTNNHVVDDADSVKVTLGDGRELTAKVIGTDKKTDIAVIKVDAHDLPAVTFANSDDVLVGDRVLAVGNPFGIGETVTSGIVSGTGRSGALGLDYEDFIQTDAAINPGNSGGALVDMRGRLIGLNTAILSRSGGFQGIGFAIPANLARHVMDSLVTTGKVVRGFLGVTIQDVTPNLAEQFHLQSPKGAIVSDVTPDSPAAKAGLKSDDVILDYNGKPLKDSRQLKFAVAATTPGSEVKVRLLRDGKEETVSVKVGELPGEKQRVAASGSGDNDVLDGVEVSDLDAGARNEFEVPARVHGALVTNVDPGSAAAEAGLAPGDVIQEINHQPVRTADDAVRLTEHAGSRKTLLKLWSHGGTHYLVVDETDGKPSS
ncbi:MAG TPA: DegQ family serine endoprotease [Opitutaceae bacterium]|nr:DegQ family serine endoprotease [Opitutaceae bacterium]